MKAPSPLCLVALRRITLVPPASLHAASQYRNASSTPSKPAPPPPPPRPTAPPGPAIRRPPREPGHKLRQRRPDDPEYAPQPLAAPIGMAEPPHPYENWGRDERTLRQRRDDFVNYDKHLVRRAQMTRQMAKPYFRDWSSMRFHRGKIFVAPERLFRAEHALYFPNFFGRTLRKGAAKKAQKDGYGGLGRSTTDVLKGKVSVVGFFANLWAWKDVESYCSKENNAGLRQVLEESKDVAQMVEIQHEDNVLRWWILKLFGLRKLRTSRDLEQQEKYFIVRRGISDQMKESIGLLNDKGGYVYLVDKDCKIRWAASAQADPKEKEALVNGLRNLVAEARGQRVSRRKPLEAVAEVIAEDQGKTAAVG